jgi:hypothetical protein
VFQSDPNWQKDLKQMRITARRSANRLQLSANMMLTGLMTVAAPGAAHASDHLDTPSVIADARTDIGDIFAWTAPNGKQLNLVMAIVGHSFSNKVQYVFHVDSGKRFSKTTATITIACRIPDATHVDCIAGQDDEAHGDASGTSGLLGQKRRFRVFAGLRDDPFFNNVRGTRAAYNVADAAQKRGALPDAAGCPQFESATVRDIRFQWGHTSGEPATNFLAGWTPASLVIAIDLDIVAKGGKLLAVWGATVGADRQIDRAARPLTGNALLGTLASEQESDALKERYNAATPATSREFVPEIQKSLGLYDGFDGICGNQLLANKKAPPPRRYLALATLLADDRLWVNSASTVCSQLFAVERASLAGERTLRTDCGGRTPNYSAVNAYRSLLTDGTMTSIDDGVDHDDHVHSTSVFPFLAAPDAARAVKQ